MKKILCIMLVLVLTLGMFSLSGCGKDENKNKESDDAEVYIVKFRTDLNTGYDWSYEMSKKGIVKLTSKFVPYEEGGMSGNTVFTVKALKRGSTDIYFKRIMSEQTEPDAYANYTFKVNDSLGFDEVVSGDSYIDVPPSHFDSDEPY